MIPRSSFTHPLSDSVTLQRPPARLDSRSRRESRTRHFKFTATPCLCDEMDRSVAVAVGERETDLMRESALSVCEGRWGMGFCKSEVDRFEAVAFHFLLWVSVGSDTYLFRHHTSRERKREGAGQVSRDLRGLIMDVRTS